MKKHFEIDQNCRWWILISYICSSVNSDRYMAADDNYDKVEDINDDVDRRKDIYW